ncbi:hypothetical protein BH24CHL5_BH24CHL5_08350 [soil metagenome]
MTRFLSIVTMLFVLAIAASPVFANSGCDLRLFDRSTDPPTEVETLTYSLGGYGLGIGFELTGYAPDSEVTIDLMKNGETYQSNTFTVDAEGQFSTIQFPDQTDIGDVTARATGGECTAEAHYTVLLPDTSTEGLLPAAPLPGVALWALLAVATLTFLGALRRFAR